MEGPAERQAGLEVMNGTLTTQWGVKAMEKKEVCTCTKCGNEAEMTVTCEWVDVEESPGIVKKKQKETKKCSVCGNEADMIIED